MKRSSAGQLLLVGIAGTELDEHTAKLIRGVQPGGFILFGRNIKTPTQLRKLLDDLRDLSEVEPIITIDQEGGRVSRLRLIGNEPPNAQQLRDKADITLVREHGRVTGQLLRMFGFNLDLCPVLDISFDDDADNSLRGRCYGTTVEQVVELAGAFNDAMREEGILSCGKHFPGYTAATLDAHHELPRIDRTREELEREELAVFRAFVGRGGSANRPGEAASQAQERSPSGPRAIEVNRPGPASLVDSMMICHGWYPVFEPLKRPASLSRYVITDLLRNEMKFGGLVMTDDLDMGAILNEYSFDEMLRLAIEAGNDLAMICHRVEKIEEAASVMSELPGKLLDRALHNVHQFKSILQPPTPFSETRFAEIDAEIWNLRVAVLGEEGAAERSPEDGKRSPVEMY